MKFSEKNKRINIFEKFSCISIFFAEATSVFILTLFIVMIWLTSGPFFYFPNTWYLVLTTGTIVGTFLMVFLIQRMRNKYSGAMPLKLNGLVASLKGSSHRLIDAQGLTKYQ